jgi:hypothetical protein
MEEEEEEEEGEGEGEEKVAGERLQGHGAAEA